MTPTKASNGKWTDNQLTSQCVIGPWLVNNTEVAAKYSTALTATPTSTSKSTSSKKSEAGGRHFGSGRIWDFEGTGVLMMGWAAGWAALLGTGAWL